MRTFLKIIGVLALVVVLVIAALAVFVRFYLTDERLQAMLVPRAEVALGRQVTVGDVDVSLFKGIELEDFLVKSADGRQDFLRVKEFVLNYQFWPLLKNRRLVISEIRLEKPFVRLERLADGSYNFESLAFLQEPAKTEKLQEETGPVALPLALTVDRVHIDQGRVVIEDALGKIPPTEAVIDGAVSVAMGADLASLRYQGKFDLVADISAGEVNPHLTGTLSFEQQNISYALVLAMAEQKLQMEGSASGWPQKPQAVANLTSDRLDVDRLLAAVQVLSQAGAAPPGKSQGDGPTGARSAGQLSRGQAAQPAEPISAGLPPGLTASGKVRIKEAIYQGLLMSNLHADYLLENGLLTVDRLSAQTADGTFAGTLQADLTKPDLAYQGNIKAEGLQARQLLTSLFPQSGGLLSGILGSAIRFSGSGTAWDTIKNTLSAEAEYQVADGQIQEMPITTAVASLLQMPELRTIGFRELDGSMRLQDGRILLDTGLTSQDLQIKAEGFVGLDGNLQIPLVLQLAGPLADKIRQQASVAKYLSNEQGQIVLNLKLAGSISKPRPTLDTGAARRQLEEKAKEKVQERILRELDKTLQKGQAPQETGPEGAPPQEKKGQPPVEELLRGIFGK